MMAGLVKMKRFDQIRSEQVRWLWYPYIPAGKITLIQGDPGDGKTSFILAITALLTRGLPMPCTEGGAREPVNVIYQNAEDGLGDTVKPRLEQAGADCSRVQCIDDDDSPLTLGDSRIEKAIVENNAKLFVVDPLQAFLGNGTDMHRANATRPLLHKLSEIAEQTGCAIVLVGHMNKSGASKGMYRGLGSIDIAAAARSILLIGRQADDSFARVMAPIKSSNAAEGASILFTIDEEAGVQWLGESDETASELLSAKTPDEPMQGKYEQAEELLLNMLSQGALPCTDVFAAAKDAGIGMGTLKAAKRTMGILSQKRAQDWFWMLTPRNPNAEYRNDFFLPKTTDEPIVKTVTLIQPAFKTPPKRLRVAAYARVSSGKDAMLHSLSAQVSYYSEMIQANPGWTYCGVYADEDYTGTKADRPEFQRLLTDCRAGKLDMVICKCNSRFGRNTVTVLESVRELKALNIDCYFEEERIHTMDEAGELLLTILASFAQEESLSVSENCKWKIRHGFQDGKPTYTTIYGYRMKKGKFIIVPEEAKIVKMVFALFLSGLGRNAIMKRLIDEGITTRNGKHFSESVLMGMLQNEKYAGDLLLQKTFTKDHLTKRQLSNRGEFPSYYVTDDHEAIIDRETFERVQEELIRRREEAPKRSAPAASPFTGMIVCGNCGHHYKRKVTHGKAAWNCLTFIQKGKAFCHAKQIPEDTLYTLAADVLGLDAFDEKAFRAQVTEIRVPAFNHVVFVFRDGREVEQVWQDRSRSESWTAEMKAQAANHARRRRK